MRHAFAIEIYIGLFDHAHVIELRHDWFLY